MKNKEAPICQGTFEEIFNIPASEILQVFFCFLFFLLPIGHAIRGILCDLWLSEFFNFWKEKVITLHQIYICACIHTAISENLSWAIWRRYNNCLLVTWFFCQREGRVSRCKLLIHHFKGELIKHSHECLSYRLVNGSALWKVSLCFQWVLPSLE